MIQNATRNQIKEYLNEPIPKAKQAKELVQIPNVQDKLAISSVDLEDWGFDASYFYTAFAIEPGLVLIGQRLRHVTPEANILIGYVDSYTPNDPLSVFTTRNFEPGYQHGEFRVFKTNENAKPLGISVNLLDEGYLTYLTDDMSSTLLSFLEKWLSD
jgi:hypothetical protein